MNGADIAFPNLGIFIPELPKGITIGGFTIAFYGIIMAASMMAGLWIACLQAKRTGQNKETYMDFAIYGIIFSLIGARLYYVIFSWDAYKDDLLQIFNTRGGGMALYGSVIAGILTAVIYCRVKKYNFFLLADTAVAGLILGQIIGRYGNFFNREAFGEYTNGLFAMRLKVSEVNPASITDMMREHMQTIDGVSYIQVHPTFLYESLWNVAGFLIIVFILRKLSGLLIGEIAAFYAIWYSIGRYFIEGMRTDSLMLTESIRVAQFISIVTIVIVLIAVILRRVMKKDLVFYRSFYQHPVLKKLENE